ncbi:protein kinase domain-containing protein [Sorangium sp. So ce296]|uniref:protein kinase domain-containing protein n=1 Tax=Sorangium sp. So ce296 TaxID=3133296 RepID=UPI003F6228D2
MHRDLKPANLLLTRRPNGEPLVKVLDFGISKRIKPDATDLTNTLVLLGSPFSMAPEQMIRAKRVDTRSDVWSMGVVLHHLVTGMMPFPAETLTLRPFSHEHHPDVRLEALQGSCRVSRPDRIWPLRGARPRQAPAHPVQPRPGPCVRFLDRRRRVLRVTAPVRERAACAFGAKHGHDRRDRGARSPGPHLTCSRVPPCATSTATGPRLRATTDSTVLPR